MLVNIVFENEGKSESMPMTLERLKDMVSNEPQTLLDLIEYAERRIKTNPSLREASSCEDITYASVIASST